MGLVPASDGWAALTGEGGLNAILDVVLEGQKTTHPSILKEYQQDGAITARDRALATAVKDTTSARRSVSKPNRSASRAASVA